MNLKKRKQQAHSLQRFLEINENLDEYCYSKIARSFNYLIRLKIRKKLR